MAETTTDDGAQVQKLYDTSAALDENVANFTSDPAKVSFNTSIILYKLKWIFLMLMCFLLNGY